MSNPDNKTSIFQKMLQAGEAMLDQQIQKAKTTIINQSVREENVDDLLYSKAIVEDPSYALHSQGWLDKPNRLQNSHLKQMSYADTMIAGVIQTRQNQVANHAKLVKSKQDKGFMIVLADEDALLEKIKEELKAEKTVAEAKKQLAQVQESGADQETETDDQDPIVAKADEAIEDQSSTEGVTEETPGDDQKSDDEVEAVDWELERKARQKLQKQFEKARKAVEEYVLSCGRTENRPFETKKWTLESALRAMTRDTLTYDLHAVEVVPDRAGRPHHWFPIDGGTVKQASQDLRRYKDAAENFFNMDILFPERTSQAEEKQRVIDLDPELLEKDAYKWVQVIRGKVERAYTGDELKVGIRNVNTDIYNNGYGISELELLMTMVTGHLNAEYYNQAYFTQGFSAKGILHIKAAINRRKLETVRMQWQHMLKGAKNSFQTPIFAGVEDVNWIPLTQNHNDIGFEGWMRYLITMIGVIYQIDPSEMGIHLKAEGSGGSMNNGDSTDEKIRSSKDRGLFPLLTHFENHLNENIIKPFDARFKLKFTGVDGMDSAATLERQKEEVKFKKTVNEIRAEDGLPPLPGMDDVMLSSEYMTWYQNFSDKASKKNKETLDAQSNQMKMQLDAKKEMSKEEPGNPFNGGKETKPEEDLYGEGAIHAANEDPVFGKSMKKSAKRLSIEVYKIEK